MNNKFNYLIRTMSFVGILILIGFRYGLTDQAVSVQGSQQLTVRQITTKDVVGVWVNHHDKDIHQKITCTKNHQWHENQHGVKNIYSGSWQIIGKRTIKLAPYGEKIVFNKYNRQQMNVVSYHHILNKKK
ncbi:hypothetical protein [Lapidilactobacillus wuchangensis]|uniref:hypothetical protein n=1 Tax=Lapidilactobacillus wuchangensis TaxID=2486001 RepID=UPI0013DE651D|nr:hypothetical protein [Lapidilactobacillus wuchangensis]